MRWLPTAPENGQSDHQSLEQPLRVAPNHPATLGAVLLDDTSTPGGFVPGELARFQETSRSRNASTAGAGQADADNKTSGTEKLGIRPLAAHSSPAHERADSQATRRPGRQQPSQAAPASGAAQA